MKRKIILTAVAVAAIAVSAKAQALTAPAGQAYTIESKSAATAVTPVTYQWFRDNSPIANATKESYTVPAGQAYGDNVQFYRMATAQECAGIAEKKSNIITITFTGYIMPPGGCNLIVSGVCWADAHIDNLQTFATRADMYTKFYQWNRLTVYSLDDPINPEWNATPDNSETWTVNPCPMNWRLPSLEEYKQLINSGNTWAAENTRGNQIPGRFFGYNHATCQLPNNMNGCVFIAADSYRNSTGVRGTLGTYGYGWCSTQASSTTGYSLRFYDAECSVVGYNKGYGYPVRCVR